MSDRVCPYCGSEVLVKIGNTKMTPTPGKPEMHRYKCWLICQQCKREHTQIEDRFIFRRVYHEGGKK